MKAWYAVLVLVLVGCVHGKSLRAKRSAEQAEEREMRSLLDDLKRKLSERSLEESPEAADQPASLEERGPSIEDLPEQDIPDSFEQREASMEDVPEGFEQRDASMEDLPESFEQRDASMEDVPDGFEQRDASMEDVPEGFEQRDASMEDAPASFEQRGESVEDVPNIETADSSRSFEAREPSMEADEPGSFEERSPSMEARSFEEREPSMESKSFEARGPSAEADVPGSFEEREPSMEEDFPGSLEERGASSESFEQREEGSMEEQRSLEQSRSVEETKRSKMGLTKDQIQRILDVFAEPKKTQREVSGEVNDAPVSEEARQNAETLPYNPKGNDDNPEEREFDIEDMRGFEEDPALADEAGSMEDAPPEEERYMEDAPFDEERSMEDALFHEERSMEDAPPEFERSMEEADIPGSLEEAARKRGLSEDQVARVMDIIREKQGREVLEDRSFEPINDITRSEEYMDDVMPAEDDVARNEEPEADPPSTDLFTTEDDPAEKETRTLEEPDDVPETSAALDEPTKEETRQQESKTDNTILNKAQISQLIKKLKALKADDKVGAKTRGTDEEEPVDPNIKDKVGIKNKQRSAENFDVSSQDFSDNKPDTPEEADAKERLARVLDVLRDEADKGRK